MTDRELLQMALDTLRHLCLHSRAVQGYDGEQVQSGIDALKARLAEPEILPGQMIELTAAEVKILRRASLNDRQFAEMIQAKLRDKNS